MPIMIRGQKKGRPRLAAAVSAMESKPSTGDDFEFPDLPNPRASDPPPPEDPARIAVGLLLAHALRVVGVAPEVAGRDGAVCVVILSDAAWVDLALEEWRVLARSGQVSDRGFRDYHDWHSDRWVAWPSDEPPHDYELRSATKTFAQSVAAGCHCVGFTPDLGWLPSDLVQSADYRLTCPPLTSADVAAIATCLCRHEPVAMLSDEEAAALTPRLLRLARRLDQSADAYVMKLRDLLDRERVVVTPDAALAGSRSPRDSPTLDRLHGMDEAVAWGRDLALDLELYKSGQIPWGAVDRGLLLSGPPGCGKTLFARALATTCEVPLISGAYGQWLGTGGGHQGDLLRSMRTAFAEARASAPSILFVDEVDSFPNRSNVTHRYADWETQIVNALLAEIDGIESREGVVLLAACNQPDKLDPALIRSGRLDRHIRISLPDTPARAAILREHLDDELPGEDLAAVALAATGCTGADCERLVRGARRRARNAGRDLTLEDLMSEIDGNDTRTPADLWTAAVHEAGHAVALRALEPNALVAVSLLHDHTATSIETDQLFVTTDFLQNRLIIILAGRAAEEVILGKPSSGAGGNRGSDLAAATRLVAGAAAGLGLDREWGLLWLGVPDDRTLARMLAGHPALGDRIRTVTGDAYADALELIRRRSDAVAHLAVVLQAKRVMSGEEVAAFLARYPADRGDGAAS